VLNKSELKKLILREFHVKPYLGHIGYHKTLNVVKIFYYWQNVKKDVEEFVARCLDCQMVKAEYKHIGGLLQLIAIPKWKWEVISIDFITGLPRIVREHDSIIVVVDKLTNIAHFIIVMSTF